MHLSGALDHAAACALAGVLDGHPELRLLVVDCTGVVGIEPVGARALAGIFGDWVLEGRRRVELQGMSEPLLRQLRRHPLAEFCAPLPHAEDDELFRDPFSDEGSGGWRPSRH